MPEDPAGQEAVKGEDDGHSGGLEAAGATTAANAMTTSTTTDPTSHKLPETPQQHAVQAVQAVQEAVQAHVQAVQAAASNLADVLADAVDDAAPPQSSGRSRSTSDEQTGEQTREVGVETVSLSSSPMPDLSLLQVSPLPILPIFLPISVASTDRRRTRAHRTARHPNHALTNSPRARS